MKLNLLKINVSNKIPPPFCICIRYKRDQCLFPCVCYAKGSGVINFKPSFKYPEPKSRGSSTTDWWTYHSSERKYFPAVYVWWTEIYWTAKQGNLFACNHQCTDIVDSFFFDKIGENVIESTRDPLPKMLLVSHGHIPYYACYNIVQDYTYCMHTSMYIPVNI